jgi:hypothetical protein
MKKLDKKKLTLDTQTVRELSTTTLKTVGGGYNTQFCQQGGSGNIMSGPVLY